MRERDLHKSAHDFFRVALPPDALAFHPINEGRGGWCARAPEVGGMVGLPDWLILYRGRLLFVELKSRKGWISPQQKACHARLRDAGAKGIVARSLEEIEMFLIGEGVPLRAHLSPARVAA